MPLPAAQLAQLLIALHREADILPPTMHMAESMVAMGSVRSLKRLRAIRGFGRRRRSHLRSALSSRWLSHTLPRQLHVLTNTAPAIPEVRFPHPFGEEATFPPLVARALMLEGPLVLGTPIAFPGFPFAPRIVHFFEAVRRPIPQTAVIIGAGYVGAEMAVHWARAGSTVTLIDRRDELLRGYIGFYIDKVHTLLEDVGVVLKLEVEAVGWEHRGEQIVVFGRSGGQTVAMPADLVLVSVGISPRPESISRPSAVQTW